MKDPNVTLRCDDLDCGYEIETEFGRHLVGTPCPNCGTNMLTRQEYRLARRVRMMFTVVEWFWLALCWLTNREPRIVTISVHARRD